MQHTGFALSVVTGLEARPKEKFLNTLREIKILASEVKD